MSGSYRSKANPQNQPEHHHHLLRHPNRAVPPTHTSAEAAYERLSAYAFARRYAQGKIVADLIAYQAEEEEQLGGGGYALGLLAQSAESVVAALLDPGQAAPERPSSSAASSIVSSSSSSSTSSSTSSISLAPNVSYLRTELPDLALPESHFDCVVAFGVIEELEHPEELVREAKRILKEGGVFLISVPDKQTQKKTTNELRRRDPQRGDIDEEEGGSRRRRGAMYVPEVRGLLERHFGHVRLYHQGAVAGGLVFPVSRDLGGGGGGGGIPLESVRLSLSGPRLGMQVPTTRSVMGVCSDDEAALGGGGGGEEGAYLLLEGERRVFHESEERAEDVELLLDEIRRMQETEVQAFLKAIRAQQLPLGVLLRWIPQILTYYLYDRQANSQKVGRHRGTAIEETRHRWDTTVAKTRHRRDKVVGEIRYGLKIALTETRHRLDVVLEGALDRRNVVLKEVLNRRNLVFAEIRHRRNSARERARLRRRMALEEARLRRNMALEEARLRRNMALEAAFNRRNMALEAAFNRRNLALEEARHRRNLVFAEIRHRRNVTLERIIHYRNIIYGNMHAIRQKGPRGLAKGAFRRLSVYYRRL